MHRPRRPFAPCQNDEKIRATAAANSPDGEPERDNWTAVYNQTADAGTSSADGHVITVIAHRCRTNGGARPLRNIQIVDPTQ